jgi:putative transposase
LGYSSQDLRPGLLTTRLHPLSFLKLFLGRRLVAAFVAYTGAIMPHSRICCLVHVVFTTAEQRPCIRDEFRERLHRYVGGIARELGTPALAVGGTTDHIHLLISLPRTLSVAKAVQLLKASSSKWIHENFARTQGFAWQEGYGAFSIGVSQREVTVRYIERQEEHHRQYSFAEEMKKFLDVHGIEG